MEIGLAVDGTAPLPDVLGQIERAATAGFATAWLGEVFGWDPLTVLAALGGGAPGIRLGTAVMTTFPRHPLALAAQALTTQAATGGRLSLGVGPSHQPIVEGRLGMVWDPPLLRVREYLDVLQPVLGGAEVDVRGATTAAAGAVSAPGAERPPVLLSAQGPKMLALAGERTDGAITLWARPRHVADFVVPTVTAAAGGRTPRIVVGVIACVTADPEGARRDVAERLAAAASLPSYRGSLDQQGLGGLEDAVVAGDESVVADAVRRYAEAGVTELVLSPSGEAADHARTIAVFAQLARDAG